MLPEKTYRDRIRDERADVLAGERGATAKRAVLVGEVETLVIPAVKAALSETLIPTGAVFFFPVAPADGWRQANGAAVSRIYYKALFATIGTTFGTGDGSTTFNLPTIANLSGMVAYIKT